MKYPIYCELIQADARSKGMIVRFDDPTTGTVIKAIQGGAYPVEYSSDEWTPHTDKKIWRKINYDKVFVVHEIHNAGTYLLQFESYQGEITLDKVVAHLEENGGFDEEQDNVTLIRDCEIVKL